MDHEIIYLMFTLKDGWKPPHEDPEKNRPLWRPGDRGQPTQHTGSNILLTRS